MIEENGIRCAIIEDNQDLSTMLVEDIKASDISVAVFPSAEEFMVSGYDPHIVILDINRPGQNGFEFSTGLRESNPFVQIIALRARSGVETRVLGYNSGIDIYLEKPVSSMEILAILRRSAERISNMRELSDEFSDPVSLILHDYQLSRGQSSLHLTERERDFLRALINADNCQLAFDECGPVCGDSNMQPKVLSVFIGRYRKKIWRVLGVDNAFQSVRGYGYRLGVNVHCAHDGRADPGRARK